MQRKKRGNVERRGRTSRVRIMVGKTRHSFTLPTTDRSAIADFVKRKRAELEREHSRRALGLDTGVAFSRLLDLFERDVMSTLSPGAQEAYGDSLPPFREYFIDQLGDPPVESIQAKHIDGFMTWRRSHRRGLHAKPGTPKTAAAPLSNRTVAKDRAVLHRVFEKALRLELRESNPVARTEAPASDKHNPVILTSDEYERLLNACAHRPMLELYVLVLAEAGLRANTEALRLKWEDVDLEGGFLCVTSGRDGHRTKSGKSRWVPLTPRLRSALREHAARYRLAAYGGKRSPWVFHHDHDHHKCRAGERIQSLFHGYKAAAARAKLSKALRQHDLRHRRVTVWLAEGKNPVHVKEAMGHADLRTTMEYTHLAREHLRSLVDPAPSAGPLAGPIAAKPRATAER